MELTESTINAGTLELVLRQGIFKQNLAIDRLGIQYKKRYVPFSEIESLRYGATNIYINGIHASVNYRFDFLEGNQKKFSLFFSASSYRKKRIKEAQETNQAIIDVVWKHLMSKIVNTMIQTLNSNGTVNVGNFEVERKGIRVIYRKFIFLKREAFLPWKDCLKGVGPGYFYIQSNSDKSIKAKSSFLSTWNLNALHSLINYLWENGNCFKLERGEKI